jgi:5'-3' exonuclease
MGVPYYFYVITQQHTGILRKTPPENIDRFFLDYNGGVHPVCHRLFAAAAASAHPTQKESAEAFENRLCEASWAYMLTLVQEIRPAEVHIALDGVAPIAKIQQQRKRRYLSILRQKMLQTFSPWDTNAISPGTAFMKKLNHTFREKIKQTFSSTPFHFYGSDEPGEGEHKIFQCLKASARAHTPPAPTVIYGLDADLIMLSLLSHHPQIFLMREHQDVRKHEEGFVYLDIDALRVGILKTLRKDYQWPIPENLHQTPFDPQACNVLENYVVACFLLGNDFLPNITCFHLKKNGIATILHTFKEAWDASGHPMIQLETHQTISMDFLAHWFGRMAKTEDTHIARMNEDYYKKRCFIHTDEDKVEFYPIQPENKSPLAFALMNTKQSTQWRALYYKYLLESERQDRSRIVDACREYIHGILWTYRYYKQQPKPYDWYYPFGYAPTLLDLSNQLSGEISVYENTWKHWDMLPLSIVNHSIPPLLQLLSILPKESHGLLPESIQKQLHAPTSTVRYMYPTTYSIYTYMKQHLWECHPKLPLLDFKALRDFLKDTLATSI